MQPGAMQLQKILIPVAKTKGRRSELTKKPFNFFKNGRC